MSKSKNSRKGQIAFWEHDQFPYILSGEIDKDDIDGVHVKNYAFVIPFKILKNNAATKKLVFELDSLTEERRKALRTFEEGFEARRQMLAHWLKPK